MADGISQVIREIVAGDGITQQQAADIFPGGRGDGTATKSRISRWIKFGYERDDGVVVKLEAARFGVQILTSRAALARFAAALSAPTGEPTEPATPEPRTPARRRKDGEAASKRLAQAGA